MDLVIRSQTNPERWRCKPWLPQVCGSKQEKWSMKCFLGVFWVYF
jgi:hypothetical protein